MADFRALCAELVDSVEVLLALRPAEARTLWTTEDRLTRARAALAEEPAVPEGREPAAVTWQPSDAELLCIAAEEIDGYGNGINPGDYEASTECAVEAYGSELCAYARAVLARWGNHVPAPPADGEVAELTGQLIEAANGAAAMGWDQHAQRILRVAELLQRQVPVPVAERLPEPNTKVLAHYFNDLGKGRTICAIWVPAKSRSNADGDDDFTEYDEEDDKFYWPEGWYEVIENWDELGWVQVYEGEVDYWQPLPEWPAQALPLPEVGE